MFAIFLTEGMNPFYQTIASFPTIVFTVLLGVVLLYWAIAVLGLVDIEFLDFDLPETDSVLGAADQGLSNPDVLAGLLLRFGLTGVPVTIIVSCIALFGWLISYYLSHFFLRPLPEGFLRFGAGIPILGLALYVATMITAQVIKPMRPLFKKALQQTVKKVLGQSAVVRTSVVNAEFGEALLEDGGAGLILKVRATGDATYTRGDRVVLLEHRKDEGVYRVISEDEFRGG
ncbi:MAG: DUF1449 domain-containing protein [Pseudomonadota bacterium]